MSDDTNNLMMSIFSSKITVELNLFDIKEIFDKVKWDIRNYSVELVIFDDAQRSRISTKRD